MQRALLLIAAAAAACCTPGPGDAPAEDGATGRRPEAPTAGVPDEWTADGPTIRDTLTGELRDAFDVLLRTERFTDAAIYDGGATPREVVALRIIAADARAPQILRALLDGASLGGRLYALCGLCHADPAAFERGVTRLRGTDATIEFQTGCSTLRDHPVAELIDAGPERAVRLDSRAQTIREWKLADEARGSLGYDIVGGGFPDLFRTGGGYGSLRAERLADGVD